MTLLVDIGNSRVKWAVLRDGQLTPQQAGAHAHWQAADWQQLLAGSGARRVVVASVAGGEPVEALRAAAVAAGCSFERVFTSAVAAGVRNSYPDPRLLGVDRWLAAIAAHALAGGAACCVLDVGTAATIDAVDAGGQHLGGFIVPGPRLMVSSLHQGTSDLAAHTAASGDALRATFADNTRDAIERGAVVALAALAERSLDELSRGAAVAPVLFVTGGAAPLVTPYLRAPARQVPDLVLRGLAAVAGG